MPAWQAVFGLALRRPVCLKFGFRGQWGTGDRRDGVHDSIDLPPICQYCFSPLVSIGLTSEATVKRPTIPINNHVIVTHPSTVYSISIHCRAIENLDILSPGLLYCKLQGVSGLSTVNSHETVFGVFQHRANAVMFYFITCG